MTACVLEVIAKGRWCPFARQVWADFDAAGRFSTFGSTSAFNVVHENHGSRERRVLCVGSACMAWRHVGHVDTLVEDRRERLPIGYCGLAGAPLPALEAEQQLAAAIAAVTKPVECSCPSQDN